jgi:hypothetical protein
MHYMLPPEDRLVGAQLHRYIRDQLYWVLHAPRQTGKTTFLLSWMKEINAAGEAAACYVTVERCQGMAEPEKAMPVICEAIQAWAQNSKLPVPSAGDDKPESQLNSILSNWAKLTAPRPLVVLFDEVDVLMGETMISFLRQLRDGFAKRGVGAFPVSIALVGMRDLKDYITAAKGGIPPNPGSPFNIKEDSATIGNFTKANIASLFARRTAETGQRITQEALDYVWEQSRGQPWIVNNLFKRATMRVLDEDSTETVTINHIKEARQQMILARETHLDSLSHRLDEPGVRDLIEKFFIGNVDLNITKEKSFEFCRDLGLVDIEDGQPVIANPIYREVLAREMTWGLQLNIPKPVFKWEKDDGSLDMDALLKEFQRFWRRNSEEWDEMSGYTEAFPHLLLMAFLQRVTNGSGHIDREYAVGRGRMDLAVEYHDSINIIEIKLLRKKRSYETVKEEGLEQIKRYRDGIDASAPAYLIIFDRRPDAKDKPWEERLIWTTEDGVTVVGC